MNKDGVNKMIKLIHRVEYINNIKNLIEYCSQLKDIILKSVYMSKKDQDIILSEIKIAISINFNINFSELEDKTQSEILIILNKFQNNLEKYGDNYTINEVCKDMFEELLEKNDNDN